MTCAQGLAFQCDKEPYNSPDFRWAIALAMNFDEISMNIFDGVGRASPFPILTATSSMQNLYYIPMLEWLDTFELDLGDGTTIKPIDPDYAKRIGQRLKDAGRDIPLDDAEALQDMFGIGCGSMRPKRRRSCSSRPGWKRKPTAGTSRASPSPLP